MDKSETDMGVISAILERLEKQRLPQLLTIQKKVEAGETPSDIELSFLETVVSDTKDVLPIVGRHPEYQRLVSQVTRLYDEVIKKILEIEKGA